MATTNNVVTDNESITDGLTIKPDDILSKSLQLLEETEQLEQCLLHGYSTLLFVGSPFGGKTSIIDRFMSPYQTEKPTENVESTSKYRETIALEYRYVRKDNDSFRSEYDQTLGAKVCNVWELGNGVLFHNLIQFALTKDTVKHSSVVIVIDLTRPTEMSILLEQLIQKVSHHIRTNILSSSPALKKALLEQTKARIASHHSKDPTELAKLSPFPVPLIILGSKYDEFQNMDPEVKKQIVRYLRTVSCCAGGQLIFVSTKSETLSKRVSQALDGLAFERDSDNNATNDEDTKQNPKPSVSTNFAKPVMIPFGYDTLNRIGVANLEEAQAEFRQLFPQVNLDQYYTSTLGEDPRTDPNFSEPEVDKILEYKYMLLNSNKTT